MEVAMSLVIVTPPPATPSPKRRQRRGACLATTFVSSAKVISATGQVDASNAREVAAYVRDRLDDCECLVLDTECIEFFGVPAFFILHNVNVECAQRGIAWTLLPSPAVSRVLRVCDPDGALPLARDVAGSATRDGRSGSSLRLL
jgi:anti-anti-sigma factor